MIILNIFETVGTIAFAISGALVGMKKQLDFFGVLMLSVTTAVGGGILRDVIMGNTPPMALTDPKFCFISIISALGVWFFYKQLIKFKNIILIFDAIGLGVFTANGANMAFEGHYSSLFIAIFLGVLTGTGGGIIRDIFVQEIPMVFRKEIYATASILGVMAFYYTKAFVGAQIALYSCFIITLVVRLIAIKYDMNLPVNVLNQKEKEKFFN
jgi:uncharacterized membrane protein YeiH